MNMPYESDVSPKLLELYREADHHLLIPSQYPEEVNSQLLALGRPDLAILTEVPQLSPWVDNQRAMNNFLPFVRNLLPLYDTPSEVPHALRSATGIGLGVMGLPDFRQHYNLLVTSHFGKPSFGRMDTLFPEFSEAVVRDIAHSYEGVGFGETAPLYRRPAAQMAYLVMSRLVDSSDFAVSTDGVVDQDYLTR